MAKKIIAVPVKPYYTPEQKEVLDKYFNATGEKKGCLGKNKEMSDSEYYARVKAKKEQLGIYQKALAKLGVDHSEVQEIKPIEIVGFEYGDHTRVGLTGRYSNYYEVTWIFCSDKQLFLYSFKFDMLSDDTIEKCREYFYTDITTVYTLDETKQINHTKLVGCKGKKEENSKSYKHYSNLYITVPQAEFSCAVSPADNADFEANIRALKAKIRDKKHSVAGGANDSLF